MHDLFECSVEVLARIGQESVLEVLHSFVVFSSLCGQSLHLNRLLTGFRTFNHLVAKAYVYPDRSEIHFVMKSKITFLKLLKMKNMKGCFYLMSSSSVLFYQTSCIVRIVQGLSFSF